jgi:D-alanyl-D-alanine carboxypeptidase/D-alanyl-D-alanine-endopeptidase (penicillin-binding protein 4)
LKEFAADFYSGAGIDEDDVVQTDGSGLSRQDMVTPRSVVGLLQYAETRRWFDVYYSSLPISGVDGDRAEVLVQEK